MPRVCVVCQADIPDGRPRSKYCSNSCSKKASYQRNKERHQERGRQRYQNNKEKISLQGKLARAAAKGIDLKNRRCIRCGDIFDRSLKAEYCESCYQEHERELNRARENQRYANHREAIKARNQTYAQSPQGRSNRRAWRRRNRDNINDQKRRRYREKTGYDPEGRTCENCHADISRMWHRAKRCNPCSTPPARTCIECHIDISDKWPREKFCSDRCKEQDQQRKELVGYTKVCTKCNDVKEHTEFRLRYGRRGSTCKSCEANDAREYSQSLPVEERQRRRRIRGQRERDKKAKLTPEQKRLLRTHERKAQRRRIYGADFDEDRLYSEQGGKCAICKTPMALEELELDHDHGTKRVRGFLCKNCNLRLLPRYEKKFPPQHQDSRHLNAYLKKGKLQ